MNAILLGRLGFSAEEAIYQYIKIAKVAFSEDQIEPNQRAINLRSVLEDVLKDKAAGKENIHFMDFQNQSAMPGVYHACDLFCLPSKGPAETWGLAVNEAMACGKAILAADKVGCATDLVKNGQNGSIFKAGDIDSLTFNLQQLLNKDKLYNMGDHSRKHIADWSIEVQVRNIVSSLNEK